MEPIPQTRRRAPNLRLLPHFTTPCPHTAPGWMLTVTDVAGNRQSWSRTLTGNPITIAVAGFTRIAAGIGCPIIPGVGPLSIMAAGSGIPSSAGAGVRITFGAPRGFAGGQRTIIADG